MPGPSLAQQQRLLEAWKHPIGTPVLYRSHPGAEPVRTTTTSAPWMLGASGDGEGGHTAVISIEGKSGCVALDALTVIQNESAAATAFDMQPVESSNVAAVGFHPETKALRVKFKNGGEYEYPGVTAEEHAALMRADSIGRHLRQHIQANHEGHKVA